MRIAIFGLGSIGKRHVRNLVEMGETDLIAYDPLVLKIVQMEGMPLIPLAGSEQDVWNWKPEIVLICTPPLLHYTLAMKSIDHGCHIFIEKPIAADIKHATDLMRHHDDKKKVLAVGYQLRWSMDEFRSQAYGQDARFTIGQDMSTWPSHYQKDILAEYSHEIDATVFTNGPVEAVVAFVHGSVWQLHLRHLRAYSDVLIMAGSSAPPVRFANAAKGTISWSLDLARNDLAYKEELTAFLKACQGEPFDYRLCSCAEAVHVVRIIQACRESAQNCSVVKL